MSMLSTKYNGIMELLFITVIYYMFINVYYYCLLVTYGNVANVANESHSQNSMSK